MENKETDPSKMTIEELNEFQDKQTENLKKQIVHMTVACEYEELKARTSNARLSDAVAKVKFAQLMAGPPKESGEKPEGPTKPQESKTE